MLPLFLSFFIFLISGFAETNRLPFDMPEAESELIAGYHTEYSAMKFSFFFIAEYSNVVTVCAMVTTLFFGGWDIPFTHWDEAGRRAADHCHRRVLLPQGDVLDLLRDVDPVDPSAFPLRPADGAGLEGADAAGPGLHHGDLRGALRDRASHWALPTRSMKSLALFGAQPGHRGAGLRAPGPRAVRAGLRPPAPRSRCACPARSGGDLMAIGVKVLQRPDHGRSAMCARR